MSYLPREELLERLDLEHGVKLLYPERIDRGDLQVIYDALHAQMEDITAILVRREEEVKAGAALRR